MEEFKITEAQEVIEVVVDLQLANYAVGRNGVTKIEQAEKSGMYANIPYLRVWAGNAVLAEICQHFTLWIKFKD